MRRLHIFLWIFIPLALLVTLGLLSFFKGRIPSNPPGTVGNTAGNLYNGGFFCEHRGRVYFSNLQEKGSLYSMNPDETDVRLLSQVSVRNILAGGDYLYYFQTGAAGEAGLGSVRTVRSFNRCRLNGSGTTGLLRETVVLGQLIDDSLYLLTAGEQNPQLIKLRTDKTGKTSLAAYELNPACAAEGVIYYPDPLHAPHSLMTLRTDTDASSLLWSGNIWYPVIDGRYVYYLDVDANYCLSRLSLEDFSTQRLTEDRVDCFNVGSGYIYYQVNSVSDPALYFMGTDASNPTRLAEGSYTNLNITSRYVYFQAFGREDIFYHAPLGSARYEPFQP